MSDTPRPESPPEPYRVLARKYRPAHFDDLIGQEAMVRTLRNAFAKGRIAHAFVLTGVRGVGKTTTARIIAKGLNCEAGEGPTIDPCGRCAACVSIAEGRNTDVLEMDAASNTGVGDVREIIESVRYRASVSRYKVYIVDEVHMLSTSAFNALLKTLEEPPEHVVFVFATTEIRKVPVTVLSRCQRFDLRRIEPDAMMAHLSEIAAAEGAEIEAPALGLITRAAEGSVRDALSLLDQAIAQAQTGPVDAASVRAMLGVADRGRVIDLFEAVMRGDARGALAELAAQYAEGADPAAVLRDLAELTHWISVIKVSPEMAEDPTVAPGDRARGRELAERLAMRALSRAWQMLLKAMEEIALAPNAVMAAEMALIRLTHVADLPPPEELVRRLLAEEAGEAPASDGSGDGRSGGGGSAARLTAVAGGRAGAVSAGVSGGVSGGASGGVSGALAEARREPRETSRAAPAPDPLAHLARFEDVLALLSERRELRLLDAVEHFVELVRYRPGTLEFSPAAGAPADLAGRLGQRLTAITGVRWHVVVTEARGAPTVEARRAAERRAALERAAAHPLVAAALAAFPGAELAGLRPLGAGDPAPSQAAPAIGEYLAEVPEAGDEVDETWDADDMLVDRAGPAGADDPFEES